MGVRSTEGAIGLSRECRNVLRSVEVYVSATVIFLVVSHRFLNDARNLTYPFKCISAPLMLDLMLKNAYLGAAPAASVGGTRRAASPDPKPGVPRPRSASPSAAANAAAAVAAAAAMPHQSLEHAMQTKLSLGETRREVVMSAYHV